MHRVDAYIWKALLPLVVTADAATACPTAAPPLQVDLHYNGFCNSVLWQLFHYVPLNIETKLSETRTLQFQWAAHQEANRWGAP